MEVLWLKRAWLIYDHAVTSCHNSDSFSMRAQLQSPAAYVTKLNKKLTKTFMILPVMTYSNVTKQEKELTTTRQRHKFAEPIGVAPS